MEDKKDTNPKGIVVENVARGHVLRLRMQKYAKPVGVVLLVVIVAGGAGVAVRMLQPKKAAPNIEYPTVLPQKVVDAQDMRTSGDAAGAAKAIDEGLSNPNASQDEKYLLYIQQGSLAAEKKDYAAATTSFEKAAMLKQTSEVYILLGDNWVKAKNNAKAVENYKKALPLIKGPLANDDKKSLENLIASLEGGAPLEKATE